MDVVDPIVEENVWNDTYWGVCRGRGLNKLGEILMVVRNKIIEDSVEEWVNPWKNSYF